MFRLLNRKFHRRIAFVLLYSFLSEFLVVAAPQQEQNPTVRNANWRVDDNIVVITYDLTGPRDGLVDLSVVLRRQSDASFRVVPRTTYGDIGRGNFIGRSREIRWSYLSDIPAGLEGEDYYFEFRAVYVQPQVAEEEGGGIIWYFLGTIVVGGGVAAVVILTQKKEQEEFDLSTVKPPGRPY
jgi:hypothetical protein